MRRGPSVSKQLRAVIDAAQHGQPLVRYVRESRNIDRLTAYTLDGDQGSFGQSFSADAAAAADGSASFSLGSVCDDQFDASGETGGKITASIIQAQEFITARPAKHAKKEETTSAWPWDALEARFAEIMEGAATKSRESVIEFVSDPRIERSPLVPVAIVRAGLTASDTSSLIEDLRKSLEKKFPSAVADISSQQQTAEAMFERISEKKGSAKGQKQLIVFVRGFQDRTDSASALSSLIVGMSRMKEPSAGVAPPTCQFAPSALVVVVETEASLDVLVDFDSAASSRAISSKFVLCDRSALIDAFCASVISTWKSPTSSVVVGPRVLLHALRHFVRRTLSLTEFAHFLRLALMEHLRRVVPAAAAAGGSETDDVARSLAEFATLFVFLWETCKPGADETFHGRLLRFLESSSEKPLEQVWDLVKSTPVVDLSRYFTGRIAALEAFPRCRDIAGALGANVSAIAARFQSQPETVLSSALIDLEQPTGQTVRQIIEESRKKKTAKGKSQAHKNPIREQFFDLFRPLLAVTSLDTSGSNSCADDADAVQRLGGDDAHQRVLSELTTAVSEENEEGRKWTRIAIDHLKKLREQNRGKPFSLGEWRHSCLEGCHEPQAAEKLAIAVTTLQRLGVVVIHTPSQKVSVNIR